MCVCSVVQCRDLLFRFHMMDDDHLTSDVLLPPRKRLLAGFKKQNSDAHALHPPPPSSSSPPSSPCDHLSNQFQTRLKTLLSSHLDDRNLSPDEIVSVSKSAAISAVKSAEAARAVAQDKAAIAAKAVAAAKAALELVASLSDSKESSRNKNGNSRLKKHVPVKLLYKKHQPVQKFGTDEELAHSLHRTINSSPRISNHKHKRRKGFPPYDNSRLTKGALVLGEPPSASKMNNAGSSSAKEKFHDDVKKRARVKLKKLPLSICSFRDQVNPSDGFARSSSADGMMMSIEDYSTVEMAGAQDMQLR